MTLINVENLSAAYDGKQVFSDLSFSVNEGDYLCIIGENGSGKSTLMRILLGLHKKTDGSMEFNGISSSVLGYLPQKREIKNDFPASVQEVVMSGFSGKGFLGAFYTKSQKQRAVECMELLEISSLKTRSFLELSGGQQQKVLLCRALLAADKVILLDEPVSGLDTASQKELYDIIERLNQSGMAIIMVSHDIENAVSRGKTILHISENSSFFGTAEEYLKSCRGGEANGLH